jgi:Ras-related GTP-binding protein A/B
MNRAVDVEHHHVRFLGNLILNLWDCGGQYRFYETYFDSQRDTIFRYHNIPVHFLIIVFSNLTSCFFSFFRNVEVLIYVFDVDSGDFENDITLFDGILEAMEQNSPDASIFILIHKMDLVNEEDRIRAFTERSDVIKSRSPQ